MQGATLAPLRLARGRRGWRGVVSTFFARMIEIKMRPLGAWQQDAAAKNHQPSTDQQRPDDAADFECGCGCAHDINTASDDPTGTSKTSKFRCEGAFVGVAYSPATHLYRMGGT